ncbi:PLP-dependent aminotransferase family protein [Oceanobacillus bengalensis]|uniref:PLP-dependent aminotransferase family protein n=1 Tax=Oceanobacillus bengalensis TaxID=1435466 RepID=A0A494YRE6_9BACI|nr:PLP-dependent aminotransferase family protein [Oceanobacillus bengalensis]RKQ11836.1 PLP-dependent aminotransferase family protein [Oceanobacillus bengalensis]
MDMLSCNLNRSSGISLYEQLYEHIKNEIVGGRIEYGAKLPSKRKLSQFLKISQNTVETAYDQLMAEGYIEGIPRKGYFVLTYEDLEYVQTKKIQKKENIEVEDEMKFDFHPSYIDTANFPFAKWRKYAKDTIDKENHSLLLLGDMQGEMKLRKEISTYLYQARGVRCSPDDIIIGAGSEILLQQLVYLFNKDTVYGVEDPGYHVISRLLKRYPNEVYPLEVDHEGAKIDGIEDTLVNVVYVTPSHHFPYGSVLSVNRRSKLLKWAASTQDRYIIEDDYDSEFRYSGKSIPSLQSMDQAGKVVYLGTFSKSLIPSLRISYMVLPKELLNKYRNELSYYQCTVSRIDQHILTAFMKEGDFERHLNRMRKIYRRKLNKTLDILKPYQEKVKVIEEYSGLHIVLVIKNGMNEQELVERARNAKIRIYPLSAYSLERRKETLPKIILGFAGIEEVNLNTALQLLLNSWEI